jgi:hypothetical protein
VLGLVALAGAGLIAGCGGDDGSDLDPQTVIDDTFNNEERVTSGDLSLSVGGSATGDEGGSFELSLEGPFETDPDDPAAIPQLAWTGSISGEGQGQSLSFEGGLTVTEDNAFVEYGGNAYELGADVFGQFRDLAEQAAAQQPGGESEQLSFSQAFTQSCERSLRAEGAGDTSACQINPEDWLEDLSNDGTEEIEGTDTVHVSGALDVEAMVDDVVAIGEAVPEAAAEVPSDEEIQQVVDAVSEASFDVYSGVDDGVLRGLDFNLALDPSAIPDAEAAGVDGIDVDFSLRLGAVNEDQSIEAPSGAKPIADLLGQFGVDPEALDALGSGGLGAVPGVSGAVPGAPGGAGAPGANAGAANAYLDCIAEATTPEQIEACAAGL